MLTIDSLVEKFSSFMWGTPLLVLLLGGGLFFTFYSRFTPFRFFRHAFMILIGKYDSEDDPGDISHFQALSSALASTVGMGNISGVAIAIHTGGPGAIFWMWLSAILGMSTKFFTCTLSILYRGKDDQGRVMGGPMYYIETGLGKKFKPLAIWFSLAGLFGCLAPFQSNQLTQIIRDEVFKQQGLFAGDAIVGNLLVGIVISLVVASVIFGGIKRIGLVASRMVPMMVSLYMLAGVTILVKHYAEIPEMFMFILKDAFTGDAVLGGALGAVIITGIRRAAFSNEAGIGTEAMAHGAARTKEPVREGLVAMIGPFIDTIIVCSVTAFAILFSGMWQAGSTNGVTLTTQAFSHELGELGRYILMICVIIFSLSTMIGYSYYGSKCTSYLFGSRYKKYYRIFYVLVLAFASIITLDVAINFIDGMYALMAIPTMISTLLLAPRVMREARRYFGSMDHYGYK
ncbi:MAG: alanine:cation symporter family protein [Candidatus Marinimicrobia bacterium]|jgi:AGCS family alanine or glycine:cation symporter|nr:alanine:cation symporter family protein [Candidatus Neomarinimicrobiota bacterium]MBT3825274.1 alanine:cation symporter family protein [Candidatus Neomarinimicrobiota bacterium]MBT4131172.1 alanine:cation symporter family protein [Candidatus Neomarinimicrobiota bacterium]MBT4294284.1 alanine:cation symporter family protein [Candidatus Neomarinimicrobiota bacterium]MBT4419262.1 alanine:cation symporter family protein [Candidatus Neomarinimicrobiota bacterium]